MPNRRENITQAEISRALKAAKSAGYEVARIELDPQAGLKIFIGEADTKDAPNEWDNVLELVG